MQLLFNDSSDLTRHLITVGTPFLFFFALSTVTIGALQGIDRMNTPIINAAISLVVHIVFIVILLRFCDMNVYAILYSNIVFGFLMCLLNQFFLNKYIGYRQEYMRTFILPFAASAIMGVIIYLVYRGLMLAIGRNSVATIIAVILGVVVYILGMILLRAVDEEELYQFPKGYIIVRIARKFGLM